MRSVHVHLIGATKEEVRTVLDGFARPQTSEQWLYPPSARKPSLHIEFRSDYSDFEPEDLAALRQALGRSPDVSVVADVTGRVPGDAEVRAFVECLLTRFQGVAWDEFSPHCWTWSEIRSGARFDGHPFFDYLGWHQEALRSVRDYSEEFRRRKRARCWLYWAAYSLLLVPLGILCTVVGGMPSLVWLPLIGFLLLACGVAWRRCSPVCPDCRQNIRTCPASHCHLCGNPLLDARCARCGEKRCGNGWIRLFDSGSIRYIDYCPGCGARLESGVTRGRADRG